MRRIGTQTAAAVVVLAGFSAGALAESALPLEAFGTLGERRGLVYDESGGRVGEALVAFEEMGGGEVLRLRVETRLASGVASKLEARMRREGAGLALLSEESTTFDDAGRPKVSADIDHVAGSAVCRQPDGAEWRLDLPTGERVANVALPLALLSLARGERDAVRFQFLLCRETPRVLDAEARVVRELQGGGVEVAARFDLGPVLGVLAGPFLPTTRFWLDPASGTEWLGHQTPLFPGGPELAVVREGVAPGRLLAQDGGQ